MRNFASASVSINDLDELEYRYSREGRLAIHSAKFDIHIGPEELDLWLKDLSQVLQRRNSHAAKRQDIFRPKQWRNTREGS